MPMIRGNYNDVRERMRSGDIISFGGKHPVSRFTKATTQSSVSHVGVILQTSPRKESMSNGSAKASSTPSIPRTSSDMSAAWRRRSFVSCSRRRSLCEPLDRASTD